MGIMRRRIGQLVRQLLRVRERITKSGVLFTLALVLVAATAIVSANNLLFLILATMMSTMLMTSFISRLCLADLKLDLLIPKHVTTDRAIPTRLYMRNVKF